MNLQELPLGTRVFFTKGEVGTLAWKMDFGCVLVELDEQFKGNPGPMRYDSGSVVVNNWWTVNNDGSYQPGHGRQVRAVELPESPYTECPY